MGINWIAASAVAVFAVLSAGILMALRTAVKRLSACADAAGALALDAGRTLRELRAAAREAAETAALAQRLLARSERLFGAAGTFGAAAQELGQAAAEAAAAVKRATAAGRTAADRMAAALGERKPFAEALELVGHGLRAWLRLRNTGRCPEGSPTGGAEEQVGSSRRAAADDCINYERSEEHDD